MEKDKDKPSEQPSKFCKGKGYFIIECTECWGTGVIYGVRTLMRCKKGSRVCPTCNGKGVIKEVCFYCCGSG